MKKHNLKPDGINTFALEGLKLYIIDVFEQFFRKKQVVLIPHQDGIIPEEAREKISKVIEEAFEYNPKTGSLKKTILSEDDECELMDHLFEAGEGLFKEIWPAQAMDTCPKHFSTQEKREIGSQIEKILEEHGAYKMHIIWSMYATVEFDRPVNSEIHIISPGDFEMKFGKEDVSFGFCLTETTFDHRKPNILYFVFRDPDYEAFPHLLDITPQMLAGLSEIKEFFVFTGEKDDPKIKPVTLKSLGFNNYGKRWEDVNEEYDYSDSDLVKNYRF